MPSVSTVNPDAPALLLQLSDSHLFAEADGTLLGMNTCESLRRVIELVCQQQPRIDLIVATGDLFQDGTLESYQQFRDMTASIGAPARWIPGNHDEPQIMAHAAAHSDLLEPVVDVGNWRITLLDSAVPGSVPGYLQDSQLQLLAQALSEAPAVIIWCASPSPQCLSVVRGWTPSACAIPKRCLPCWTAFPKSGQCSGGHVHQEIDRERNGVRLLASPSTCIQFAPGSEDFQGQ